MPSIGYKIGALFKAVEVMMIDWNEAPKGARWWAMDANGQAHCLLAPNVAPFTDLWYSDQVSAPGFGFNGNWKENLTELPDIHTMTRMSRNLP